MVAPGCGKTHLVHLWRERASALIIAGETLTDAMLPRLHPRGSAADRGRRCGAGLGARPASPLQFLHRAPRQPVDHCLPPAGVMASSACRSTFALACSPGRRDRRSRRRAAGRRSRQAFRRSSASRCTRSDCLFAEAHRSILRGRREDRGPSRRRRTKQWRSGYHPAGSQGVGTMRPSAFVAA